MSTTNRFDLERPAQHMWRLFSRWRKRLTGAALNIDDISVIRLIDAHGTAYEARRGSAEGWSVYRVCTSVYDGKESLSVSESLGLDVTLPEALDKLVSFGPPSRKAQGKAYDHPVRVARMIGHIFT